jgi:signal peptidase II
MNETLRNSTIIITLTILDQIIKFAVQHFHTVLNFGIFFIHEVRNTGASFGILKGQGLLLVIVSIVALGLILLNTKHITKPYQIPMSILTAGIIGNLLDRLIRGYVVDYFDLGWWPAFNLADTCIFIGVFWTAGLLIKDDIQPKAAKKLKKN